MTTLAIVEAFSSLPDPRRGAGQRHNQALCLALFTLAVVAGCRGFLAMGDWLSAYPDALVELFAPAKERLPSYSTIRRVLTIAITHVMKITKPQSGKVIPIGKPTGNCLSGVGIIACSI